MIESIRLNGDDYYNLKNEGKLLYPTWENIKENDVLIDHSGELFVVTKITKENDIPSQWLYSLKYLVESPNLVPNYKINYKLGGIVRYFYIVPETTLSLLKAK